MTKDQWIQKAKILLFDCLSSLDSKELTDECSKLIIEAGGYDFEVESSETALIWRD